MAAAESAAAPSLLSVTATQMLMAQIPVKLRMLVQVPDLGGPRRGALRSGKYPETGSFARHELPGGIRSVRPAAAAAGSSDLLDREDDDSADEGGGAGGVE